MPKKTSGFLVFTTEWKSKYGKGLSFPEAITRAGEIWANMNAQQRGPYKERAKKGNIEHNGKKEKLNCNGIPISVVKREAQEMKQKEHNMKAHIEQILSEGVRNNDLEDTTFYFIIFNYFAKSPDKRIYIPAEVAVCEYSLRNGMNNLYTTLINPDTKVFGYLYDAQQHADNTHKLPLPPNAMGDPNCEQIYKNIIEFIRGIANANVDKVLPPVFTYQEHMPVVVSCLEYLKNHFNEEIEDIKVYSIHYLFFALKRTTVELAGNDIKISPYLTDLEFNRDFFEYESGISCDYHEEIDRGKYCAKSRVIRWSYVFSDFICGDLAIELLPGKHAPVKANLDCVVIEPNVSRKYTGMSSNDTFMTGKSSIGASENYEKPMIYTPAKAYTRRDDMECQIGLSDCTTFKTDLTGAEFPTLNSFKNQKKSSPKKDSNSLNPKKACVREPKKSDFNMDFDNRSISSISSSTSSERGRGRGIVILGATNVNGRGRRC